MSNGIGNKGVDYGGNQSQPSTQISESGGTLEDVSADISDVEKVSKENYLESLDKAKELRGGFSGGGNKTPTMYTYDKMVRTQWFGKSKDDEGFDPSPFEEEGLGKGNLGKAASVLTNPNEGKKEKTENKGKLGTPSIFNPFVVFTHPNANKINDFLDLKGEAKLFPKFENQNISSGGKISGTGGRELTIESLLKDFDPEGEPDNVYHPSMPYYASDFLYARWYKKIPLNRLITLRRFPFPTYDNLEFTDNKFKPISQAVTYFGEPTGNDLKELTKMAGQINWEQLEAEVHDVEGNEQGFDQNPFGGGNIGKVASALTNPQGQDLGGFRAQQIQAQKFNNFDYTNKVLGPVNVINQTYVRKRGIGAKTEYAITFEYELRSYNNINPRIAMLDLLCNMLALTFNNAKFWGGANRYFPNSQQFGFPGDQKAFYQGRYGDYMDSVLGQISVGGGSVFNQLGNMISSLLNLDFSALGGVAKKAAFRIMDLKRAKSRPKVIGFHALLTGLPIGEWHMTIGNPYRPIMMIGNLICKGFEFEMSDHLGADDFPSVLKFTVNLEHGRPRDKGDVESMFGMGGGRMYYPPEGLMDITNISTATGRTTQAGLGKPDKKSGGGTTDPTKISGRTNVAPENRAGASPDFARKLIGTNY